MIKDHLPDPNVLQIALRDILKFPALAEMGSNVLVGFLVVGETQILSIPEECLVGETPAYGSEQHPFRVRSSDAEVRAGRIATLAGLYPVLEMSRRTLDDLGRFFEVFHPGFWNQADTFPAIARAQITFCANKNLVERFDILRGQIAWQLEVLRHLAFIPIQG